MLRHRRRRQMPRAHDAVEIALQQRHAGAFHGDVGAGAHGDADIGGGQRRRVVDAVAGHGDDAALLPQAARRPCSCPRGRTSASTSAMPSFCATALAVVALSPVSMTTRMPAALRAAIAAGVVALIGIGDGDDAGRLAVDGDEDRSGAFAAQLVGVSIERCRIDAGLGHDARDCRSTSLRPSTVPVTPLPTGESKLSAAAERKAALVRRPHDGGGQRMLAAALEACRRRSRSFSSMPAAVLMATTLGLPSVSVPVLSTTACRPSPGAPALRRS